MLQGGSHIRCPSHDTCDRTQVSEVQFGATQSQTLVGPRIELAWVWSVDVEEALAQHRHSFRESANTNY